MIQTRQQSLLNAINLIVDPRERVMRLREATASYPGYPFFWLNYAMALLHVHRKEEARDAVNRALNLDFPADKLQPELRALVYLPPAADVTTVLQPFVGRFQTRQTLVETDSHRLIVAFDSNGAVLLRAHPDLPPALAEQRFQAELTFSQRYAERIPDCAQVLEVIHDAQGVPFEVLRLPPGLEPIHQVRAHGMFGLGDVIGLLRELADLCAKLHSYQIFHGDLRADYVLCDRSDLGRQRIFLLGTAERPSGRPAIVDGLGPERLAWLPTEHHLGRAFDARTDVSGLGMILYFLLAGRPPPSLRQRMIPRVPCVRTMAGEEPDLDALIWRCLAVYPQHRPDSAAAFERELAGLSRQRRGALLGPTTLRVAVGDLVEEQQDLSGRVLGAWRLGQRLDVAVVGEVYEAQNVHMEKERALVHALPLFDEAERATALLQAVTDLSKDNRYTLTVREYARTAEGISFWVLTPPPVREGSSWSPLADLLKRSGPLSVERAAQLVLNLALALKPLHLSRRWHGELCPANLLVVPTPSGDEELRLLAVGDGLARAVLGDRAPPLSPAHLRAPEQTREGGGVIDDRADLYALGVVLLSCLTRADPLTLDPAQREAEIERLPPPVQALLRRLLAEHPEERPHLLEVLPLLTQLRAVSPGTASSRRIVRLTTVPRQVRLKRLVRAPQRSAQRMLTRVQASTERGRIQRLPKPLPVTPALPPLVAPPPLVQPPMAPAPPSVTLWQRLVSWRPILRPVVPVSVAALVALLVALMLHLPGPRTNPKVLPPNVVSTPPVNQPPPPPSARGSRVVYPVPSDGRLGPCNFGDRRPGVRPAECFDGHCGIDIFRPEGTKVFALLDGVVEHAERDPKAFVTRGIYLQILSRNDTMRVFYLHLRKIHNSLQKGSVVKAGDLIGEVGTTGVFKAPAHLHISAKLKHSEQSWLYHDLCAVLASAVPAKEPVDSDPAEAADATPSRLYDIRRPLHP